MTAYAIEYQIDPVLAFLRQHGSSVLRMENQVAFGWRRRGEIVAGVVFDKVGRNNAWVHIAAVPGAAWLTKTALRVPFIYAFSVCKLNRISGYIAASNIRARKFVEHLGFQPEAVLTCAAEDGGDIVIYVMWAEGCRYVDSQ